MKRLLILIFVFSIVAQTNAQIPDPISWNFSSKKTADKTYEVQLTATIQPGWHLYSQVQPKDAIAIPTGFTFKANPLLVLDKKIKEVGKIEKFHDEVLKLSANQYSEKVVFVQVVKMKANAKTNLSGSVEYQTCDDKKCLPPKTVDFSVALK